MDRSKILCSQHSLIHYLFEIFSPILFWRTRKKKEQILLAYILFLFQIFFFEIVQKKRKNSSPQMCQSFQIERPMSQVQRQREKERENFLVPLILLLQNFFLLSNCLASNLKLGEKKSNTEKKNKLNQSKSLIVAVNLTSQIKGNREDKKRGSQKRWKSF